MVAFVLLGSACTGPPSNPKKVPTTSSSGQQPTKPVNPPTSSWPSTAMRHGSDRASRSTPGTRCASARPADRSPDGDLIAFMSNRCHCGSEYDVYTIHPDGTELKQLTSLPGEEGVGDWSPDGRWIAFGRDPDRYPGIYLIPRDGGPIQRLQPTAAGVHLRGVGDWEYGGFIIGALEGDDPQTSPQSDYWAPRTGRTATLLVKAASGAEWRPSGEGRSVATLTLKHRWLGTGPLRLEVTGTLTIGGEPAPHRKVILGRLGAQLPTERIRTVTTDGDGAFRVVLSVDPKLALGSEALRAQWRFATAFHGGSPTEWSTTAFDPLAD